MPTDDRSFPTGGPHSSPPRSGSDELNESARQEEEATWDRMQNETAGYGDEAGDADHGEAGAIVGFLEQQLQERPLPTLLAALFAGWLLGKLLR